MATQLPNEAAAVIGLTDALAAIGEATADAYAAFGRAIIDGLAAGLADMPPFTEQARAYQHARMVAALTCPWAPPGPVGAYEVWLGSIVQEGGGDANLL